LNRPVGTAILLRETSGFCLPPQASPDCLATGVVVIALLAASNLRWGIWELSAAQGSFSMANGLPACSGLWVRDGFTYWFRDPDRGEIVTFHARGAIRPDSCAVPRSRESRASLDDPSLEEPRVAQPPAGAVVVPESRSYPWVSEKPA
jgi:hypothetical protein